MWSQTEHYPDNTDTRKEQGPRQHGTTKEQYGPQWSLVVRMVFVLFSNGPLFSEWCSWCYIVVLYCPDGVHVKVIVVSYCPSGGCVITRKTFIANSVYQNNIIDVQYPYSSAFINKYFNRHHTNIRTNETTVQTTSIKGR